MTKDEILKRLREWQDAMQATEAAMNNVFEVFGCDPDADLPNAVGALQGLATRQAAQIIGTSDDWLMNWWLEDNFGEKPLKVKLPGQDWREVKTLDELAQVINDELAAEEGRA